jgi:hypothetical protein
MEKYDLLNNYQDAVFSAYSENGLTSIRGIDDDNPYRINGKNVLEWYHNVIHNNWIKSNTNYYDLFDDLSLASDTLLYFTGQMYLYRPFLNNPLRDAYPLGEKILYPNYQNLAAKRYGIFTDTCFQALYNYWGRIGNIIITFFPSALQPDQVYFPSVIQAIPKGFRDNDSFRWLNDFAKNKYPQFNAIRKQIVHYQSTLMKYQNKHHESFFDEEEIKRLTKARYDQADYFKAQIEDSLLGFTNMVCFLEEADKKLYPAIANPV